MLVVGGGQVGTRRVERLLEAGARVSVVAPSPTARLAARTDIELHERAFEAADVEGMWLVQACAPAEVNAEVVQACEHRRVWCVDAADAATSPAWTGSVVTGPDGVAIAVSGGATRAGPDSCSPNSHGRCPVSTCARSGRDPAASHWSVPGRGIPIC